MGIHRFAPIPGFIGDMGWLPLRYTRQIELLRYWNKLIKLDNDRLTKKIFKYDYNLKLPYSWCHTVENLLTSYSMNYVFENLNQCDLLVIKNKVTESFQIEWKTQLENKQKLRFYKLFKTLPDPELYITTNLNCMERSLLSQLRLGILPIAIETGRYKSVPKHRRICEFCNIDKVENEIHVLFECSVYEEERLNWLEQLDINNTNVPVNNLLTIMFKHPRQTGKYLVKIMEKRRKLLYI